MENIERKIYTRHYPIHSLVALLVVLFLMPVNADCADSPLATEWKELSNRKGIRVLSRKMAGTKVIAFKGIVTIDADIGVIINTINDKSRHKEWVNRLMESKTLEQNSPFESIEYNRVNCPWPISDRDFVFRSIAAIDEENNRVVMNMKSVASAAMPAIRGVVRGELRQSLYTLTRLEEGKTKVEVEFYGDPKGWIPTWVANIFQRRWPDITLTQLRNQVTSPEIKGAYAQYDSLSRYYIPFNAKQLEKDDWQGSYRVSKSDNIEDVKAKAVLSNLNATKTISYTVKDKTSNNKGGVDKKKY